MIVSVLFGIILFFSPDPFAQAFPSLQQSVSLRQKALRMQTKEEEVWNPTMRKIMGGVSAVGALETAYLTYNKLGTTKDGLLFCNVGSASCASVLDGPYANVPFTDLPLSALGLLSYAIVFVLAVTPIVSTTSDDKDNRIGLLTMSTIVGTFSVFLMVLLQSVLHESCLYCYMSAALSWTLCGCAWLGGCLPSNQSIRGLQSSAYGFLLSTATALALFVNTDNNLVASASDGPQYPPPITAVSSDRALGLAAKLGSLDAKMYGAFWCSHCYDQKQSLGKQAFTQYIRYIECSKDGVNTQADLCRERDVPGYPTWEINGKLYPGEQELDELESIIQEQQQKQ